jgi:hypothetical protein
MRFAPQHVTFPKGDESTLQFTDFKKAYKCHFWLAVDFECFLTQSNDANVLSVHVPSGFGCYRVTDLEQYRTAPYVYSGSDVMEKFFDQLITEYEAINDILSVDREMNEMSAEQKNAFAASTTCPYTAASRTMTTTRRWDIT